MTHFKLNILPALIISMIMLASCGTTANGPFSQVEDDVYFSRKNSEKKDVYVPEVDVQEIIKANPPQYGNDAPVYYDNNSGNSDFNYDEYKARQNQNDYSATSSESFLNTVPYIGEENEAADASLLRQQYAGNYTTNNYYINSSPYSNWGYNNWGYPSRSFGVGYNSWSGWNVGFGYGWNTGWNTGWGYGWPHYNPYYGGYYNGIWGHNPWGYNAWAWNGWYGPSIYHRPYYGYHGYHHWHNPVNSWGHNSFSEPAVKRAARPRDAAGSTLPGRVNAGTTPRTGQSPSQSPRVGTPNANPQQGQLMNRDGRDVYVAPQQNRRPVRSYDSYPQSVQDGNRQREAAPANAQPRTPSNNTTPGTYNRSGSAGQTQRPNTGQPTYSQPQQRQPQQPQQQQRTVTPNVPQQRIQQAPPQRQQSVSPAPSAPRMSPPSGGNRGGGGSGSSGGGSRPRR
jgi:hypothetical protein